MLPEKEFLYKQATQKLLESISKMKMTPDDKMLATHLTRVFRDAFQWPAIKQATLGPELQQFGDVSRIFRYDSTGFCRASSMAFANIMNSGNNKPQDWQLRYIDELWTYGPHHFLYHKPSKVVFDLTFDQFSVDGVSQIPYDIGRIVPKGYKDDAMAHRFVEAIRATNPRI